MHSSETAIESAELLLPSKDVAADIEFWTGANLGFRMDNIYPADDPRVVSLSGHGLRLRLSKILTPSSVSDSSTSTIRLLYSGNSSQECSLVSPSGTRVEFHPSQPDFAVPTIQHQFSVRRLADNAPWIIGRAGMHYRDLIPDRLGGSIIASHIRIPNAGIVPDQVHYHDIGFQLIYCRKGWVEVIYEDQGPSFVLRSGDCVTQPPGIRHRVLESGEGLEVIEVGCPAEHLTTVDHDMVLPNGDRPVEGRQWAGQKFVRSKAEEAIWGGWRMPGFEARDTGVSIGTDGAASVNIVRPVMGKKDSEVMTSHDADILFAFVLSGSATLNAEVHGRNSLTEGDAYTIPPRLRVGATSDEETRHHNDDVNPAGERALAGDEVLHGGGIKSLTLGSRASRDWSSLLRRLGKKTREERLGK